MRAVVCAGTLIAALAPSPFAASQVGAVQAARGFDVVDYTARLEPRIAEKTFTGRETIRLRILQPDHASVTLDSGALVIDAVREDGRVLRFAQSGGHVSIDLPRAAAVGDSHAIEFDYHGTASSGLVFVPERSQVYTSFATNQWLVSVSAPDERATIGLSVAVPAGLTVVAGGRPVSRRDAGGGLAVHEWRQDRPMPAYTFGFAAGPFSESMAEVGGHTLRTLGSGFSDAELRRLVGATADAVHFFEERSGVPYGDASYTQVLVAQTAGQEMTGYSILSEAYGRALLADERVVSLAAHELAHQWWGNGVTNRAWTHFWLNEGFATFMADAYIEQRFGREAYLAAIATSRERYEKVRDAGHDRPLVFPDWDKPTADDRTLPYHKGAYLLHLLRDELGERQFWDGIRQYTRAYTGRSVTTQEFERSMEMSSGRNLAAFFDPWFR